MKKWTSLLVAGALLVGLCGCTAGTDFLRDNVSDEVADAYQNALDQGAALMESALDQLKSKLKAELSKQLTNASEDVRAAVEKKIDELKDIDADTPIFLTVPNQDGNGIAMLANFPEATPVTLLTEYPIGTKFPDPASKSSATFKLTIDGREVKMLSMQCQAYARYIQVKLYGGHDAEADYSADYVNVLDEVVGGNIPAGTLTPETLKQVVTAAGPGAHMRTQSSQHSMIIAEVTDDGFVVLEAIGDGKMTVEKTSYTWKSYVNCTFGKRGLSFVRVYRPN